MAYLKCLIIGVENAHFEKCLENMEIMLVQNNPELNFFKLNY